MPEGVPLYSDLTVKEFVSYMADLKLVPHKEKKEAVEKAIMQTGLDKVRNRLTRNLSRGFKQRVSMAGALVGEPEILILDEPTVGLDPKQVKEIRELIKSLKKNHTVILSSHILSEVSQICEKVIIIDRGEIIAVDTPENLEKSVACEQIYFVTIEEDGENNFEKVFENDEKIEELKLLETKDDKTKVYKIKLKETDSLSDTEFRKNFAIKCAENNILNLGMSKKEVSLEDAFIKLIENRTEYSNEEIKKMQYQRELEDLRKANEEKQEIKELKKEQKEKLKEEKKEEKEAKKQEKAEAKENKKASSKEDENENEANSKGSDEKESKENLEDKESKEENLEKMQEENKNEGGDK
jgi:ABC-2 type transport system ATP-binding protein